MRNLLFFISAFLCFNSQAVLLDKIVAVVNDRPILLSQIKRVSKNVEARRNISPQIYSKNKYSRKEIIEIKIQEQLLRGKLTEIGYIISDDQVEAQIKNTEDRLGLNRAALLNFLKSNNFSFDEYFELIRSSIEYNLFISRIIQPLISITEQDVKNAYYNKYSGKKRLSFKYELVDFSLPSNKLKKGMLSQFTSILTNFQQTGILPSDFSEVSTNNLGELREGDLNSKLKKLLSSTEEGKFSKPTKIGGQYHVFFVKRKDLVESEDFLRSKNRIRAELFQKSIKSVSTSWFKSEAGKHYIKYFL
ncbi:MAG: SurA N-terminal domain-containing protein [Halobacteriovoraceae bacterium]|nr:SurA N-terminal domain-containing protein [Halobacteriovoraceae bacterium]